MFHATSGRNGFAPLAAEEEPSAAALAQARGFAPAPVAESPGPPDGDLAGGEAGTRLTLPCDDPEEWSGVVAVLGAPLRSLTDLDAMLTKFSASRDARDPQQCAFFASVPGSAAAGAFDFDAFFAVGAPLLVEVALQMPALFAGVRVPIAKMRSSWPAEPGALGERSFSLTRRQCACLLAHSFLGSLKRPADVQHNDFRFTVSDLFVGPAAAAGVSAASATTFLNYWSVLGKRGGKRGGGGGGGGSEHAILDDGERVCFRRRGFRRGRPLPWRWDAQNAKPLCEVKLVDGAIADCAAADRHVEFANAFIGGGVMTGDAAQEELQFLESPELMVAMALQCRLVDEEAVVVEGARRYSDTAGFGQGFAFAGDHHDGGSAAPPPAVCAIDAVRGGGIGFVLRDMNKARIAFDGARQVATGHWGCGAFGNNHDLMFLKQWLAASEAGARKLHYHDFDRNQSHHIFPLVRRLKHMTVGQLAQFVLVDLTGEEGGGGRRDVAAFSKMVADISTGHMEVPGARAPANPRSQHTLAAQPAAPAPAAEPAPAATAEHEHVAVAVGRGASGGEIHSIFPLQTLQTSVPEGVRADHKEQHLSPDDFRAALGMDAAAFAALPQWKKHSAKRKAGIY